MTPEVEAVASNPLLEKRVTETQGAALLTAAITSVVNVLSQPGVARTQAELQMYLPNATGMIFSVRVLSRLETGEEA
ncbi:MAG: hypothetical protein ABL907_01340 [Hyphomicrobium sp.]